MKHFELFAQNREFNSVLCTAVVNRTERVLRRRGFGNQTNSPRLDCCGQQFAQEFHRESRHIACDQQIPLGRSDFQSRVETAYRAAVRDQIGHYRDAEMRVALVRTNQSHATRSGADPLGGSLQEGAFLDRQQRPIARDVRTAPAAKDESRAGVHEKMVTMPQRESRSPFCANKKVYICCLLLTMLAASPLRAADPSAPSSLLTNPASSARVSTVRVDRQTGKLVRTVSGGESRLPTTPRAPVHIQRLVAQSARAHNVDPLLVESVIQVESNYNHYAVSAKGAEGLMQLMPGTARTLGVSNSFDPAQNIEAGVKYLRYLQSVYKDDRLALAAYNAGPKAVDKYNGTTPFSETRDYVNQV